MTSEESSIIHIHKSPTHQKSDKPPAKINRARSQSARTKLHKRAIKAKADYESYDESNSSMLSNNNKNNHGKQQKNGIINKHNKNGQLNRTNSTDSNESTNTLTSKTNQSISNLEVVLTSNPIKFSCSSSLVDLCTLIFRYRDACQSLIEMIIPVEWLKHNQKFFQAKFNCLNNMFQVSCD